MKGAGMLIEVDKYLSYWRPAFQDCICGSRDIDWNESGARWYNACCDRIYLDDRIVSVGKTWLNKPLKPKSPPTAAQLLEIMANCPVTPDGMTTALYRRYDSDDLLLYLGITDDLHARSSWHERHSPWAPFVARRATEWFASRSDATVAERAAIKSEAPVFNRQHGSADQPRAAAEYLLQRRRFLLLEQAPLTTIHLPE